MNKKRVLLGSPVHQKPEILREFLESLSCLLQERFRLDYMFYDDNSDNESKALLERFSAAVGNTLIRRMEKQFDYQCDENTHHWNEALVWKVAGFKDEMIAYAGEMGYDYLFLIDSDILLEPSTIAQLIAAEKDIVSGVFWTVWYPGAAPLPNVWCYDHYDMVPRSREENLTTEENFRRQQEFLRMLKMPGIYEVGMLGACTLISRAALSSGISFKPLYNLSMWGEDRHFCIRAAALGFKLYADTHCMTFHIYRESELDHVEAFKKEAGIDEPQVKLALYPDVRCPICGSDAITGFRDYISFKLLNCKTCGLKFQAAGHSRDISSLISETYGPSWIQMREQYSRDTFLGHARFNNMLLEIFCSAKGRLLEIGSGTGEFLYMAREAGWEVIGVEPGADACKYAQEKLGLKLDCTLWDAAVLRTIPGVDNTGNGTPGADTRNADLTGSDLSGSNAIGSNARGCDTPCFDGSTFNAVAFWHVLEHIADPEVFLKSASAVLKPDGLLFFSFPNNDSLYNEVYGKASSLYTEQDHLMHYNRQNLSILLEKAGLESVTLFTRQEPDGLEAICKALSGGNEISFEKLMGISAKLQSDFRGYELVCVARKKKQIGVPAAAQGNGTLS